MRFLALILVSTALAACGRHDGIVARSPGAAPQQSAAPAVIPPPPKAAPVYLRDHYAKLPDCAYDWGAAQKCTPVPPGAAEAAAGTQFLGPVYLRTYREETQSRVRQDALDAGYTQRIADESSDRSIAKSEVKS